MPKIQNTLHHVIWFAYVVRGVRGDSVRGGQCGQCAGRQTIRPVWRRECCHYRLGQRETTASGVGCPWHGLHLADVCAGWEQRLWKGEFPKAGDDELCSLVLSEDMLSSILITIIGVLNIPHAGLMSCCFQALRVNARRYVRGWFERASLSACILYVFAQVSERVFACMRACGCVMCMCIWGTERDREREREERERQRETEMMRREI